MGYCCRKALVGLAAGHSWSLIYPSHYLEPIWQLLRRRKESQLECDSCRVTADQGSLSIYN